MDSCFEDREAFDRWQGCENQGSISTYRHVPGDELPRLLALLGLSLRWFSTRCDFIFRGPLAMSGDSLVVTTVGRRVLLAPSG